MKHIFYLCISVSMLALTACVRGDLTETDCESLPIEIEGCISSVPTKVADDSFCDGDKIGVFIVDYDGFTPGTLSDKGNRADNLAFTLNEPTNRWIPAREVSWKDRTTHIDMYGYYPYSSTVDVDEFRFSVQQNQNRPASDYSFSGYEASDFLWAKAQDMSPEGGKVNLTFTHRMAAVKVTLSEGAGFGPGEWDSVEKQVIIRSVRTSCSIDLSNGDVIPSGELCESGVIPLSLDGSWMAVVPPQTVPSGETVVSATIGGIAYSLRLDNDVTYVQSHIRGFSLTVNKRQSHGTYELVLGGQSISAWEDDAASHDAVARQYLVVNVETPGTLAAVINAMGQSLSEIKNIKVTGRINSGDLKVMNGMMPKLQAVNIRDASVQSDEIPSSAFRSNKTIVKFIFPDSVTKIGSYAFHYSNISGTLTLPMSLTEIGSSAFCGCSYLSGVLRIPDNVVIIESHAFNDCNFSSIYLPDKLKSIGSYAFQYFGASPFTLKLPESLETCEEAAFASSKVIGDLRIPSGITAIPPGMFSEVPSTGNLYIPDGVNIIGQGAFRNVKLRGELIIPSSVVSIGEGAFRNTSFSGTLVLPDELAIVEDNAFSDMPYLSGRLVIPGSMTFITQGLFSGDRNIEELVISQGIQSIGKDAFRNMSGLRSIVCQSHVPPQLESSAFEGVPKDNFPLEVPESAVQQYKIASGWSDFKRIVAHRELSVKPDAFVSLNARTTREFVLYTNEDWIVESQPDWVNLSSTSGHGKTLLSLTFDPMVSGSSDREGEVVFKLAERDYSVSLSVKQVDCRYVEDEFIPLNVASKGDGVNVVILGDGFDASEVNDMLDAQMEACRHFFAVEPFASYRDYFNVYAAVSLSSESGVGGLNTIVENKFGTSFNGSALSPRNKEDDYAAIFDYACGAPGVTSANIRETVIIVIPNTNAYGGRTVLWNDGRAISYCPISDDIYPYDFRGTVQHEACGHAFGKLADEQVLYNTFIDENNHMNEFKHYQSLGWFQNLSLSGKPGSVPWSHLIYHDKYKAYVDVYEGGYYHSRGVYRSEYNSCMNNNIAYFSAISREAIVRRIMQIAGMPYSFEEFVQIDNIGQ